MPLRQPLAVAVSLGLALLGTALLASAQTHACGTIQLVFRNPDLQPRPDGFIHAQGQFFAQFQAIGAGADQIETFGFSFSPLPAATDEQVCGAPAWVTGAYVENYRADYDPDDGYFIPLVTPLVPDGQYNAAVHAYDGEDNELARFWTLAVVDNCDGDAGARCDDDAAQLQRHDRTAPWPMVLPGDGKPLEGHRFTVEFGEELASLAVFLNGRDVTGELVEWEGRLWDADFVPDYVNHAGELPHCQAPEPAQNCVKYGPAYEWRGRALVDADVVRVEAVDLAGNKAVKDVHIGSGISGGAITGALPALSYTPDALRHDVAPGQSALFSFTIENSGGGDGHPFVNATGPAGWGFEWQPVHVVVSPGEREAQELVVSVPAAAPHGVYPVNVTLRYQAGGDTRVLPQALTVGVGDLASAAGKETATTQGEKASFALPLPAILAALAAGAVRLRRRSEAG